jgi:hypothetical protein
MMFSPCRSREAAFSITSMTMKGGISDDLLVTIMSSRAIPFSPVRSSNNLALAFPLFIQLTRESQACPNFFYLHLEPSEHRVN